MDKPRKKEMRQEWEKNQRTEARVELPIPVEIIKAMFDMLDAELPRTGCDHTRRLIQHWLEQNGQATEAVFAWLDKTRRVL